MAERVVSVKMPRSLLDELGALRDRHHYLDLSEQIRSVVRQRCLEITNPYTQEIRRLRDDLDKDAKDNALATTRERILKELVGMLKEGKR